MATVYAIYAYEQNYGGLHGVNSRYLYIADTDKEAEEEAEEASKEVMHSYGSITEDFESDAYDEGYHPGTEEWDEYLEERENMNVGFEVSVLNISVEEAEKNWQELNEEFYNTPEEFLDKYEEATL